MSQSIIMNFGDVFTYLEESFVFLAESPKHKIIYAARILNPIKSKELIKFCGTQQYKPSYNQKSSLSNISGV